MWFLLVFGVVAFFYRMPIAFDLEGELKRKPVQIEAALSFSISFSMTALAFLPAFVSPSISVLLYKPKTKANKTKAKPITSKQKKQKQTKQNQ